MYSLVTDREFDGENPESPYFWGDELKARIKYVNQFTFGNVNLLDITPSIPYHLTDRPLVSFWFPTADGDNLDRFLELFEPAESRPAGARGRVVSRVCAHGRGQLQSRVRRRPEI